MLSYRKSQQASLTEKLKKKNVIHVLGVSGSGTTMARLCLSAFARVATGFLRVYRQRRPLCLSAFVRVATHQIVGAGLKTALCLSAFARVATPWILLLLTTWGTLPQRIRAGCDDGGDLRKLTLPQRIRAGCDDSNGCMSTST